MLIQERLITPAMATKMLEGNTHNRGVRDSVVGRYARDMKARNWQLTHESIAFDHHGVLVDGQHRLWAVIESDTPTRFMVARDVDMGTQAVIDGALPRTMVDIMKLTYAREDVTAMQIAVAKALVSGQTHGVLTRTEIIEAVDRYGDAIRFAVEAFPRKVRFVTVAPVMTVLARAWFTQDRERLKRFAEVLSTGRSEEGEDAVIILRNWLLEKAPSRGTGGVGRQTAIYGKTERALASFMVGESVKILYAASSELFPLPEEKTKKPTQRVARLITKIKKRKAS